MPRKFTIWCKWNCFFFYNRSHFTELLLHYILRIPLLVLLIIVTQQEGRNTSFCSSYLTRLIMLMAFDTEQLNIILIRRNRTHKTSSKCLDYVIMDMCFTLCNYRSETVNFKQSERTIKFSDKNNVNVIRKKTVF